MSIKCKVRHLSRNHVFLAAQPQKTVPSHFPQPAHTPQARHSYSTGSFLFSCSGCYALLFEEKPLPQILDELIVSCWKGSVNFCPKTRLEGPKEEAPEAHPLTRCWRTVLATHRQKSGQTKDGLYSVSNQPSLPLLIPASSSSLWVHLKR